MQFLVVGLGGAVGAILRYALGLIPIHYTFPFMTFFINFSGAVIIGLVTGFAMSRNEISNNQILFLKVGFCGGYTTFSSFSLEVLNLIENDHIGLGLLYAAASVMTCVIGVYIGKRCFA